MTTQGKSSKTRTIGIVGIIAGFLALAAAFLSPWIRDAIDPPAKPIEQTAVDFAGRLAEAAKAKLKGEAYVPAIATEPLPSRFLFPGVIGLGMVAAGLGIASLIKSEPRIVGGGAIALGVGAAVVQWSILVAGAIFFILLVMIVMSLLGG
jgi:hypothetical protein